MNRDLNENLLRRAENPSAAGSIIKDGSVVTSVMVLKGSSVNSLAIY